MLHLLNDVEFALVWAFLPEPQRRCVVDELLRIAPPEVLPVVREWATLTLGAAVVIGDRRMRTP